MSESDIVISSRGTGMGAVYILLAIVGGMVATVSGLVLTGILVTTIDERSFPGIGASIAVMAFLMGVIFLVSGISSRKRMNFASTVRLSRTTQTIDFSRGDETGFRYAFGDVAFIELHRGMARGSSGESSRPTWAIFLTLKDGSRFWLDTFASTEEWASRVAHVHATTGLAVVDRTGDQAGIRLVREATSPPAIGTAPAATEPLAAPPVPSPFLVETAIAGGSEFRLKRKSDAASRFLLVSVFCLFSLAPVLVIGPVVVDAAVDPSAVSVIVALAAGLFGAVFLLTLGFILLVQLREYVVSADAFRLTVQLRFHPPMLDRWLGRSQSMEASRLRAIRVHRLEQGHFWLCLVVDPALPPWQAPQASPLHALLTNMGAFSRSGADHTSGEERLIGLWEVAGWSREGWGATVHDLRYIESRLQSILGLSEQPVRP